MSGEAPWFQGAIFKAKLKLIMKQLILPLFLLFFGLLSAQNQTEHLQVTIYGPEDLQPISDYSPDTIPGIAIIPLDWNQPDIEYVVAKQVIDYRTGSIHYLIRQCSVVKVEEAIQCKFQGNYLKPDIIWKRVEQVGLFMPKRP